VWVGDQADLRLDPSWLRAETRRRWGEGMVNWKCRKCGMDFEARSSHIDWRSGERVDPKCPSFESYAVKPIIE